MDLNILSGTPDWTMAVLIVKQLEVRSRCFKSIGLSLLYPRGPPSTVGSESDCESRGRLIEPQSGHILTLRFGHENISMTILSLPLIQEGQLSVTGERMGTKYG